MGQRELRFKTAEFRTKMTDDGQMMVSGYVNLTGEFSDPLSLGHGESFIETIEPGAFQKALERASELGEDIDFLAEHDTSKILSSTRNNSLTLKEDNRGLYMSAIITPTSWGKDFYSLISDGIIRNFSFGFTVDEEQDQWDFKDSGIHTRVIGGLDLFEVSVVRHPAYPQSYVEARNLTSSEKLLEIRKGDKKMKKKLEIREEDEIKDESEKEESELVDVTGSIIAIDQKMDKIEKKLDEVLNIFLNKDETEDEKEEENVKSEKQAEKDEKKEEFEQEDEIEEEDKKDNKKSKNIPNDMTDAINELIKEFEEEK